MLHVQRNAAVTSLTTSNSREQIRIQRHWASAGPFAGDRESRAYARALSRCTHCRRNLCDLSVAPDAKQLLVVAVDVVPSFEEKRSRSFA